jgi:hypothetical protein
VQWIPELGVSDTDAMEPIQGVENIARDRWSLHCTVCRQRVGAKIQCSKCYTAFHPLCGRLKGLTMDMREHAAGPHLPLHTVLLCHKHCTPNPAGAGVQYLCAPPPMHALHVWRMLHRRREHIPTPSRSFPQCCMHLRHRLCVQYCA